MEMRDYLELQLNANYPEILKRNKDYFKLQNDIKQRDQLANQFLKNDQFNSKGLKEVIETSIMNQELKKEIEGELYKIDSIRVPNEKKKIKNIQSLKHHME